MVRLRHLRLPGHLHRRELLSVGRRDRGTTRVRYSGFSNGYNIAVAAFGGTTPNVVTWLTGNSGNNLAPAFYVIAAAVVSLVTVLTLRENAGRALPAVAMDECAAAR